MKADRTIENDINAALNKLIRFCESRDLATIRLSIACVEWKKDLEDPPWFVDGHTRGNYVSGKAAYWSINTLKMSSVCLGSLSPTDSAFPRFNPGKS